MATEAQVGLNYSVYEHLTGHSRALSMRSNQQFLDNISDAYWKRFNGRRQEEWRSLPSIYVEVRRVLAVSDNATSVNTEESFDLDPSGSVDAAVTFSEDLTAILGEAHLVMVRHTEGRRLPRMVRVPIRLLMMDHPGGYTVYGHSYFDAAEQLYIGITRHSWAGRWAQHLSAARSGSPYRFHQAIRDDDGTKYESHQVYASGLTYEAAMDLEERLVESRSLYPRGLNMIPGGFAGIRFLGKYGFRPSKRDLENRHSLLRQFGDHCSAKGRPNPLQAALWRDDKHASSVICNNPRNFDLAAVRDIRLMGEFGISFSQIASRYSTNTARIAGLLRGSTYSRVS